MAITDRNLKVGTVLKARYKGQEYTCQVTEAEGRLRYIVDDGKDFVGGDFKSPSSAGSAVMGGMACNGWRFWTLAADFAAGNGHKGPAKAAKKPAAKAEKKAPKAERRSRNPRGKVEKFACGDCGLTYPTQSRAIACSERHAAAASAEADSAQETESQVPVGES